MRKSRHLFVILSLLLLWTANGFAQDSALGYGAIIGEPSGLSFKSWLNGTLAVDGALAWSMVEEDRFQVQSDLLWHNSRLMTFAGSPFPLFAGLGVLLRFGQTYHFGFRLPVGGVFLIKGLGLDASMEVAPKYELVKDRGFGLDAGLSIRYYPLRH